MLLQPICESVTDTSTCLLPTHYATCAASLPMPGCAWHVEAFLLCLLAKVPRHRCARTKSARRSGACVDIILCLYSNRACTVAIDCTCGARVNSQCNKLRGWRQCSCFSARLFCLRLPAWGLQCRFVCACSLFHVFAWPAGMLGITASLAFSIRPLHFSTF